MKNLSVFVTGKVQGVFFRASTKEAADKLGVKGFVRNEKDGSVYIEAEGDEQQLQQFISWCHEGPPHARVQNVNITEGTLKNYPTFEVRR